jgi:hypothetical protein
VVQARSCGGCTWCGCCRCSLHTVVQYSDRVRSLKETASVTNFHLFPVCLRNCGTNSTKIRFKNGRSMRQRFHVRQHATFNGTGLVFREALHLSASLVVSRMNRRALVAKLKNMKRLCTCQEREEKQHVSSSYDRNTLQFCVAIVSHHRIRVDFCTCSFADRVVQLTNIF